MAKRVNITYSVEIEQMSPEVYRLIERAQETLTEIYERSQHLDKKYVLTPVMLEDLVMIRENLAKIDYNLGDASSLIEGYLRYEEQGDISTSIPEEGSSATAQLQRQVSAFKEAFVNPDPSHEDATEKL